MTDNKTVTVRLESMYGSVKKHVFLWITPKICEMTVVDLSAMQKKKKIHLCHLEIIKLVELAEFDSFIGSDYFETSFTT